MAIHVDNSKMATAVGQIKKSNSSQKLDIWLNPNWTWVIAEWSLTNYLFMAIANFCFNTCKPLFVK
jgi:hypothetical protein